MKRFQPSESPNHITISFAIALAAPYSRTYPAYNRKRTQTHTRPIMGSTRHIYAANIGISWRRVFYYLVRLVSSTITPPSPPSPTTIGSQFGFLLHFYSRSHSFQFPWINELGEAGLDSMAGIGFASYALYICATIRHRFPSKH